MKIAYTISGLYNSGGMENILVQKANYLADILSYDVTIITTDQKNRLPFFPVSNKIHLIDLGINYCDYKSSKLWHLKKLFLKRKHKKRLGEELSCQKFDMVSSLMDFDFGFLYKCQDKSKKILEFHFSKNAKIFEAHNWLKRVYQKLRISQWHRIINRYDKFVVLTREDSEQWYHVKNKIVIPNFIETTVAKETSKDTERSKVVLSVGRFNFQKGFDLLIKAWEKIYKQANGWKLEIIGGGDKSEIAELIEQKGLSESIILSNALPQEKIRYKLHNSSVYVLSSRFEGLPLVLLEAMAEGLPIVSFACPCGPKDILKEGFAKLAQPQNVEHFAECLLEAIKDDGWRKMASSLAIKESAVYDKSHIMMKWDKLFTELIKANKN